MVRPIRSWTSQAAARLPHLDPVRFVGIDLAWSPRNRSGGVVLSAAGQVLAATADLTGDDSILEFVSTAIPPGSPGLVTIDAPLAVPNETGGRPCDLQVAAVFRRFEAAPYLANRRNLSRYGGLRAESIRQRLESDGFCHDPCLKQQALSRQVIEVFPHPATVSLFDLERTLKYKVRQGREYSLRWHELAWLRDHLASLSGADPPLYLSDELLSMPIEGLRGRSFKAAEDLMDAVLCAYIGLYAWYHGPGGYRVFGDAVKGHILVPMTPSMWERTRLGPCRASGSGFNGYTASEDHV
jgi:predicted RNase H-like nuclease